MIQVEAIQEGFALIVNGRRILSHSRRSPCLEIGTAENIVRQNRGGISVSSEPGRGTTVSVYLPRVSEGAR